MSHNMKSKSIVSITTLGCKVNQCESDAICRHLESKGIAVKSESQTPDICIVNTCSVTQKASMQSRQAIRKAIKSYPDAKIIVTGCYAQTSPEELAAIDGVSVVVDNTNKLNLARHIATPKATKPVIIHQNIGKETRFAEPLVTAHGSRTRPFLKIQDGCNAFCTYCIVPYARGRSRSMPLSSVMTQLNNLAGAGFKEVVLTGIHLGCYGRDFTPPMTFFNLLETINKEKPVKRVRLSSIEPMELTDQIIDLVASSEIFCRHFHIPLQSGDNEILSRMKRPYSREDFKARVLKIKDQIPSAAIGADVLVGFPGESNQAFENTFALIEELPISYLHVFPFSPRKNTPAYSFENKVAEKIIKERCRMLRNLGRKKKEAFYNSQLKKRQTVLVEGTLDRNSGKLKGLSSNYLPMLLEPLETLTPNTMVQAMAARVTADLKVLGEI